MRIIDTHAHLFDEVFAEDLEEVVSRALQNDVEKVFLPNIDETTVTSMLELCTRFPGFFHPMLGLHPTEVRADYGEVLGRMEALLQAGHSFIGIGEVGLDYSRSAQKELVDLLTPFRTRGVAGVFHSFGGTVEEARELLSFEGFMIGINGVLTFKKSALPEVLRQIPIERVVLETDAPYLSPVPHRGKRNGLPVETVAEQTYENVLKMYPGARK